jgi:aminomuconate-semialdehyde/2-hydroxymuconate-6-semialdehyde dehydrogenase
MSRKIRVANVDVVASHFIGGEPYQGSERSFETHSPIDGSSLGEIARGDDVDVERAVSAAQKAFPAWAALGAEGRAPILKRFAQSILDKREALSQVETADNGSLLLANQKRIVDRAAHNISFFADFALKLQHAPLAGAEVDNQTRYEPAGVAALITPWNAPLMLSTWKIGPALAAGDTIVLKPPEWAPLSCALLAEIAAEAGLPPGVFNVVQGIGSEAGQALIDHPGVARISFTGSTATGRLVARAAADRIVPVSLELGGKSPFIVFADADLEDAATQVAAQFNNAGQVCLAGTRILVDAAIEEKFRALVLRAAQAFTVGDPRTKGVRVGPLIHPRQFERVKGFVERARAAGATALLGGAPHERGGLYYAPTILTDVRPDAEIAQNEVFGPVLIWHTFESEEQAIALANGTEYGLTAMVYTRDQARAERVSAAVVAGTVWVNCYFVRDLGAPFGGAKRSGVGREGGAFSFDFFSDVKNVATKRGSFATGGSTHG